MTVVVGTTAGSDHHDTGHRHPERPERLTAALAGLTEAGLEEAVVRLPDRVASAAELSRVHDPAYLDELEQFCRAGGGALDPDTRAGPGSWQTALLAAGAGLAAIEALRGRQGEVAFVAARPPGHHATSNHAMGFCLINNVAVAAAAITAAGERVMIVDWDVHHGNGTQDIFWNDPRVLYLSTHQSPLYPGTGAVQDIGGPDAQGLTINVPLPPGTTGDVLLRAMDEVASPAADSFRPDWVLISAGFDAHRADPLASLELSAGDFADLARRVAQFAPGPSRVALFLEGGYDLAALRASVGASVAALLDVPFRPEQSTAGGPGMTAVDTAQRVHAELIS